VKRVVSVSLGSSKRNKVAEVTLLGQPFRIERIGTDGDRAAFRQKMQELDGQVAALGIGGADRWVVSGTKRYAFRDVESLIAGVKQTPVVDGSGLKHTLERQTIERLAQDGTVDFRSLCTLLVSAVDRYGMAQALDAQGGRVIYGDLLFGLGLPLPVRSYRAVQRIASAILPLITLMPIQWFYPTGSKQETRDPKFPKIFAEADVVAGDWHYIRRYMPDQMPGKTILTQTLRQADYDFLRGAGVRRAITTTPVIEGETFATNVMEGVIVAYLEKSPEAITPEDYMRVLQELNWSPAVVDLISGVAGATSVH